MSIAQKLNEEFENFYNMEEQFKVTEQDLANIDKFLPVVLDYAKMETDEILKVVPAEDIILVEDTDDDGNEIENAHVEFYVTVDDVLAQIALDKTTTGENAKHPIFVQIYKTITDSNGIEDGDNAHLNFYVDKQNEQIINVDTEWSI